MFHFTKKRAVVAMAVVGSLALSVGAYAYFTAGGSGTGSASVGDPAAFNVTVSSDTTGTLYPGTGSQTLTYTVTNPIGGPQRLSTAVASLATSGENIISGNDEIAGCKAAWFTADATSNAPLPQELASQGTSSGTVLVKMLDATVSQDSCKGKAPRIIVNAG